jgi:hypothetical protein
MCQLYFLLFEWFRWFWGLTCDFWAENGERKMCSMGNYLDSWSCELLLQAI